MARAMTTPPAAPSAWAKRAAISGSTDVAAAQATLARVNTTRLAISTGRRP